MLQPQALDLLQDLSVLVLQLCNELSLLFVGIKVEAGISGRTSLGWGKVFCLVFGLFFSKFIYL